MNENFYILIEILLECVRYGPIDNDPEFVKILTWGRIS